MSGIILTSYHRHLNRVDISLDNQLETYWRHWLKEDSEQHLPTSIEGVEDKYLELFNEFNEHNK